MSGAFEDAVDGGTADGEERGEVDDGALARLVLLDQARRTLAEFIGVLTGSSHERDPSKSSMSPSNPVRFNLEARLGRQRLLTRVPLVQLSFILWEPALRNPVGGIQVLGGQLRHLAKVAEQPNVELQVIPSAHGMHPGLNGPMVLLETEEHRRVGYLESQDVGSVITDPHLVSAFGLRYGKLRSLALSMEESARLIERVGGEL